MKRNGIIAGAGRTGREPGGLVTTANAMAIMGLITVGLAVSASVLLVTGFVVGYGTGSVIAGLVLVMFALLWFARPLTRR